MVLEARFAIRHCRAKVKIATTGTVVSSVFVVNPFYLRRPFDMQARTFIVRAALAAPGSKARVTVSLPKMNANAMKNIMITIGVERCSIRLKKTCIRSVLLTPVDLLTLTGIALKKFPTRQAPMFRELFRQTSTSLAIALSLNRGKILETPATRTKTVATVRTRGNTRSRISDSRFG